MENLYSFGDLFNKINNFFGENEKDNKTMSLDDLITLNYLIKEFQEKYIEKKDLKILSLRYLIISKLNKKYMNSIKKNSVEIENYYKDSRLK